MNQLRFDAGLGIYTVTVASESMYISKGMGAHSLQLQLEIGIPEVGADAGQLLSLETMLYAPVTNGPRAPIGSANASVAFQTTGGVYRQNLIYLITNAQLLALEEHRIGDLRLEIDVRAFLPHTSRYPGCSDITEHISIAESRWRQQLAGLGRTVGAEVFIPFPEDDEPRRAVADFLREAQRQLGGNEINSAMLQVRKALESIKNNSTWGWPANARPRTDYTADERWAKIRAAMEDQASGAMHEDAGTKDYKYTRAEVETLIAMTAALLRVVR